MNNKNIIKQIIKTKLNNKIYNKSILIDKYLIPNNNNKIENGEVSTPYNLRKSMLDLLPIDFWETPKKIFEPCCGKCAFLLDIINNFMIGLLKFEPNKNKRYKFIIEKCIYYGDINPINIMISKLLLDPNNKYKLNYHEGDTLNINIKKKWNINGFNAVIGNPPYNSKGKISTGNTLWDKFTIKSLKEWILENGYLLFVHPSGWRKPFNKNTQTKGLFNLMTNKNNMIILIINSIDDGKKTFNCGTRFDYYLIKNTKLIKNTIIIDENKEKLNLNLSLLNWLPNSNINTILKLINKKEKLNVIMNSSYHAIRNYISDIKDSEYKYQLIHSTPKKGIRYKYSKINNKGHFGISKIIFGESGINHVIIDIDGVYGMTQGAIGIKINNIKEGENIKNVLLSNKFKKILKSLIFGNFRINSNIFRNFNNDFWKYI